MTSMPVTDVRTIRGHQQLQSLTSHASSDTAGPYGLPAAKQA